MRATAESPLDPRACRRVKLLISNYRHTAHLRRTGHETVAHVIYQYRFGKAVKQSPCVLRLPPRPRPVPRCGVSYKSDITVRRFLRLRGRGCIYTQKPVVDTRTQMCVYGICAPTVYTRTCTARVYAPTCGRKRTKHRVQAHTRERGVGCVNAPIRVYAPFGDATNVMGRNRSNHVGYAPPAPNHLVSPLRHLRLRTISSPRFVTCVSEPISSPHPSGFASPVLGAGLSRSRMIHDARTDRPSSLTTSSSPYHRWYHHIVVP